MRGYKLAVDEESKATELRLCRLCGSAKQNPHMRAFWAATISYFCAQLGWVALAPLGLDVASSIGVCENQLYPPADFPRRTAYLMYENLKTQQFYCRFGRNDPDQPSDCNPAPGDEEDRYDPSVLSDCVCTSGTWCAGALDDAAWASVASTIFARIFLGTLLERWGPVNVQASLLAFGAVCVFASAGVTAVWNLILVRFFVGLVGAAAVTNQYWCSLMFSPKCLGIATGTASGWGNLSGGTTDILMLIALLEPLKAAGLPANSAWRVAVLVPAALMLACAVGMKCLCWDTPTRKRFCRLADLGKQGGSSASDYATVLKDIKVVLLIIQYSAASGPGLVMFNKLSTHFRTYFQMAPGDAAMLASAFGFMSLFARSLGGALSDAMFIRFGLRGRLWVQCSLLILEAVFFFAFGHVDNTQSWSVALGVLIMFALCMHMATAATSALVPFTQRQNLAITSALVQAGGNAGSVLAGFAFYRPISDPLLPFKMHAAYVFACALLTPIYYWPEHGGMFARPRVAEGEAQCTPDLEAQAAEAAPKTDADASEAELATEADERSSETEPTTDVEGQTSEFQDDVVPLMSELEPRQSRRTMSYVGPLRSERSLDAEALVCEVEEGHDVVPLMSEIGCSAEVEAQPSETSQRHTDRE